MQMHLENGTKWNQVEHCEENWLAHLYLRFQLKKTEWGRDFLEYSSKEGDTICFSSTQETYLDKMPKRTKGKECPWTVERYFRECEVFISCSWKIFCLLPHEYQMLPFCLVVAHKEHILGHSPAVKTIIFLKMHLLFFGNYFFDHLIEKFQTPRLCSE